MMFGSGQDAYDGQLGGVEDIEGESRASKVW